LYISSDNDKRLAIGYNTVLNAGFIQAMNNGVSYSPLVLNSTHNAGLSDFFIWDNVRLVKL